MLDRGEHQLDLAGAMSLERASGREPAELDALLAVDTRLLAGRERGEEEVRVEASAHQRRG